MSLSDLVTVQISASTVSPARPGFGTPLVAAYHNKYTDLVRFYSDVATLIQEGFTVNDPAYKAVAAIFAQNPSVSQVALGRRALAYTQRLELTFSSVSVLDRYKFDIVGSDGVTHSVDVASTGVPNTDAASINTVLTGFTNIGTPVVSTNKITITQAIGKLNDLKNWNPLGSVAPIISVADTTVDPGIATDLAAIKAFAKPGSFYGLALDSNSKAEITAAAAWVESNGPLLFIWNNSDTANITNVTTDIFSTEKNLAHARSGGIYAGSQLLCYSGAAMLGKAFSNNPGSITFMYKTLASVPADNLQQTAQNNLNGKNGNYYITLADINVTINGKSASGEFFDITWGVDWLTSRIQISVFATLASNPKVPYNDLGVDLLKSAVMGELLLATSPAFNLLDTTPAPTVSAPPVASIPASDRASRVFPQISFFGKLAGAIHTLTIKGVVTA